jgi:hypothetical protein
MVENELAMPVDVERVQRCCDGQIVGYRMGRIPWARRLEDVGSR